jgi:hypothetical protein
VSRLLSNPELIRNARAQLRPGRVAIAAVICAVFSIVTGLSLVPDAVQEHPNADWALAFLQIILVGQIVTLALGGAVACAQSIQKEKQMNTFDFQRVTRLTPWELTFGKLFGATAFLWFVALCLMPAAIWAAVKQGVAPRHFLAAYVVVIAGCITIQAAALLMSLTNPQDSGSRLLVVFVAILVMMMLTGFESSNGNRIVGGKLSPFFALGVVNKDTWDTAAEDACLARTPFPDQCQAYKKDIFFDRRVSPFPMYVGVNLIFAAWFLLGVARNIKRDPSVYEIFSPAQSLGFAFYLNVLLLGFFRWRQFQPREAQGLLSFTELCLFFTMGIVLLRNRDQQRRRLRQFGAQHTAWMEAIWPAPYLLIGMIVAGLAVIGMIGRTLPLNLPVEDEKLELFRLAFLSLWLVRDLLFFQWMALRRGRRSRVLGALYWTVYYIALAIVFNSFHFFDSPGSVARTAIFVPWGVFALDEKFWAVASRAWILALVMQGVAAALIVALQHRRILELGVAGAAAPQAAGD